MTKRIHIHLKSGLQSTKDANPDGTVSPDEDRREAELTQKAKKLFSDLKTEAYAIGGPFRGPGIWGRIKRTLQ